MHLFTKKLLAWHRKHNKRELPWKESANAYHIWLSEIMLQQTQAATVIPYYNKFIKKYNSIKKLAAASDDEVFAMWQGLGYYSRCKNLLSTARIIATQFDGKMPSAYDDIRALKGVGEYTAAAIASFAFGLPYAVVDGNVLRILSRYFGEYNPIDSSATLKSLKELAQSLLAVKTPAAYNQAIMDFGATICTPKQAQCDSCPLQQSCVAYQNGDVSVLPIKSKKIKISHRQFHFFLLEQKGAIYLRKREAKDIWQNLYELPMLEAAYVNASFTAHVAEKLGSVTQQLTHQKITSTLYRVKPSACKTAIFSDALVVPINELHKYSMPKSVRDLLANEGIL
ncbi:MAG: A/G-specific adenine glycosylase [Bacteroidota bacterium]